MPRPYPSSQPAYRRGKTAERIAAGLCTRCGREPPVSGRRECQVCRDRVREQNRVITERRVRRLREAGLCIQCGKVAVVEPRSRCEACSAAVYARKQRAEAGGRAGYQARMRQEALDHYGRSCACCGESEAAFLTFDHVNGGGTAHRKRDKIGSMGVWLVRNGFPKGFQVLCWNCNIAKHQRGECPHQRVGQPTSRGG